ncbi:MAG TPA: creatininase family protein [Longimicrobiales bacterium]
MAVRELSEMTWEDARGLAGGRTLAVLPVGAIEAHGPHLPLATDVIIAEAMARAGADRLAARAYDVVLLPPLAYSAAPFAAAFPGTLSLRPETATALVVDIARSLASHGVAALAIANAHLDPAHLASLHAAVAACSDARASTDAGVRGRGGAAARRGGGIAVVFPDLTRKPWALRLTEEFRSGACHAGRFESSIVMAARPSLVRDALRASLPAVPHSLSVAIREGKRTFEDAGGPRAYFGDPAAASAAEGRATIAALGRILEDAVVEALATTAGAVADERAARRP